VVIPTFIGEVEQDYVYWPMEYKAITTRWRETTTWGKLLQQYQQQGSTVSLRQEV